jgi:hypothetical protein
MNSYLKALDLESVLLSMGCMMALFCVLGALMTRAFNRLEVKYATTQRPAVKTSYGHLFLFAAVFLVMGFAPYFAKVNDIGRTPKEILRGEILEVDHVGGADLLRINTSNNRLIKVVRPKGSAWPTTPGPVKVEIFHHAGTEYVNNVQAQLGV